MQMRNILTTTTTTAKDLFVQPMARLMTTWQRDTIAHLPTRYLTPEMGETQQKEAEKARQSYETTFNIEAVELLYWDHQTGR